MRTQRFLLTIAVVVETPTGLILILLPAIALRLLLGVDPDGVGIMAGRLAGVMLLSIAMSCWGARNDSAGAAGASTIGAITLYNAGAGAFFVLFTVTGQAQGVVIWVAGLVHLTLAFAFLAAHRQRADSSAMTSRG